MIASYLLTTAWILTSFLIMGLELTTHSIHLDRIRPSIVIAWNVLGIVLVLTVAFSL